MTANESIPVADINASKLIFTPGSNGNGSGYTSFNFQVKDDGGTANSGVDTDPSANTITIDVNAVDDAPTGSVTISGTAKQGETLTAANTLADADGLGTITNQWNRAGAAIAGATSTSYSLVQADVGSAITVTANYTDGQGTAESVTSSATSAVANVNDAPTGSVTISGTATQGETLTAANTLADADGLGSISYQWKRAGASNTDATASTYSLVQADVGSAITVTANYTDGQGTAESVTSSATSAVANVNDAPTGSVTISGTATQGETLTAANTLADADGLGSISYQWKRAGASITDATASTYSLVQADVGSAITVTANYTDGQGTAESVTSSATSAVANVNDAPTGSVTISGTATQGETLTAANTLADADGLGSISYQWKRAGVAITDATASTYSLVQADVGSAITVTANYTDGQGTAESVTSSATSVVISAPTPTPTPTPTSLPIQTPVWTDNDDEGSLVDQQNVKIRLLDGDDSIDVLGGMVNFVNGNKGQDSFKVRGGQKSVYLGGADVDTFEIFGGIDNYFNGQKGEDRFSIRDGLVKVLGGDDNDLIEVLGAADGSQVNGNKAEDTITGSVAGVTYRGGADADLMIVSQGDVYGDKGADTFRGVSGEGYAVIQDYTIGEDLVEIDIQGSWSTVESGLIFTDDSGDQIMLLVGINDIEQVTLV